jgi:hypothetical protein
MKEDNGGIYCLESFRMIWREIAMLNLRSHNNVRLEVGTAHRCAVDETIRIHN